MTDTAIEAAALGRRFGRRGRWALRDCTFRLPTGRVCAVVGPNGAGKSTLLALAAGLLAPTEGTVTVLGTRPGEARARVGFVDQDKPLYKLWPTVSSPTRFELSDGVWHLEDGTYHPPSHFWPMNLVETGILLAVAATATTAAFRLLRRRTA